jgi:hypothetical protein
MEGDIITLQSPNPANMFAINSKSETPRVLCSSSPLFQKERQDLVVELALDSLEGGSTLRDDPPSCPAVLPEHLRAAALTHAPSEVNA